MRQDPQNTHRKLFASLAVLAVVFVIAAIAQFTGTWRENQPASAATNPPRARGSELFLAMYVPPQPLPRLQLKPSL